MAPEYTAGFTQSVKDVIATLYRKVTCWLSEEDAL
jgi:hypothetical protein